LLTVNSYADNLPTSPSAINGEAMPTSKDQNLNAGDAFLAANKTKPGVVTLPDGLQYKVLKENWRQTQ